MNIADFVPQYMLMLKNLDGCLDKGIAYAKTKGFEPDALLQQRLAPDQYPLVRQVQSACDAAKFSAAYLTGKDAPAHPDTETTMTQLKQRIHSCMAYLESVKPSDLEGAESRRVAPKWAQGKWMTGAQSLMSLSLPNFYFHVTTAYAILRNSGVVLGKNDFMGALPFQS